MPVPEKSVATHVGRLGSNIMTPSFIFSTMFTLEASNADCSAGVHSNFVLGFSRCLNGAISSVSEKAKDPWFTNPNHALAPVISFGAGKFVIDSRILVDGMTDVGDTWSPAKSIVSLQNSNFAGFRTIPFLAHLSR